MSSKKKMLTGLSSEDPERTEAILNSLLLSYHHFNNAIGIMDLRFKGKYQPLFEETIKDIDARLPELKEQLAALRDRETEKHLNEEQREEISELIVFFEETILEALGTKDAIEKIKEKVPDSFEKHPDVARAKKRMLGLGRDLETNRRLQPEALLELIKVKQRTQEILEDEEKSKV